MDNREIAKQWLDAFNTKNLEALLALYHPDAVHYSPKLKQRLPETQGLIQGHDAMRGWWQDAFERLPMLHYQLVQLTAQDKRVFIEYIRQSPGEEDLNVAEYLEIHDGAIVRSKVYHG